MYVYIYIYTQMCFYMELNTHIVFHIRFLQKIRTIDKRISHQR